MLTSLEPQRFSDLYRLTLFGMYILAEALQNFISGDAARTLAIQTQISLEKFNHMVYYLTFRLL